MYHEFDGEELREALAVRTGTMVIRLCYADIPRGAWVDPDGGVVVRYGASLHERRVSSASVAGVLLGEYTRRLFEIVPGSDVNKVLDALVASAVRTGPRMNYLAVKRGLGLSSPPPSSADGTRPSP